MPEEKKEVLEEICIGHLFIADDSDPDYHKKYAINGKALGILNCDFCVADEKNKQCSGYRPIRLHVYNVLPKEEPKTE